MFRDTLGVYKEHRGPLANWVWKRWKIEGIKLYEFAEKIGFTDQALSTILGGEKLLSKGNLTKLVRGLIQQGYINSGDEFQEFLDVLQLCPGYKLDDKQENRLREVAGEELKAKGIVTIDAVFATLDKLRKESRALDKWAFSLLENRLCQWDSNCQLLIRLFRSWRQE